MIAHQTIGEGICYRDNVFNIKFQKIVVVPFLKEEVLFVETTIIDVIIIAILKWG